MRKRVMKNRRKRESGQAMIEFIIVSSLILTMIFAFVQIAWASAWGHYVHYSTFMAARAYLSSATSKLQQSDNATQVLRRMVKHQDGDKEALDFVAKKAAGDDRDITDCPEPVQGACVGEHPQWRTSPTSRAYSWAEGVQYNYGVKLYILPISSIVEEKGKAVSIGVGEDKVQTTWSGYIPFTSDAFLGRERSHGDCLDDMTRLSQSDLSRLDGELFIEDNGC